MKTYVTNHYSVPQDISGVIYWERSLDPFHPSAFTNLDRFKKAGHLKDAVMILLGGTIDQSSIRKSGWMAIDWAENPIGFIADGTLQEGDIPPVIIRKGPFGHMCAYDPSLKDTPERMSEHDRWIANKEKDL